MAQSEQRDYEVRNLNLQVTCDLAIGTYAEELVYPDGERVPEGRVEVMMGVLDVRYKKRVRYGEDDWGEEWVTLDVDISDLISENESLRERCEEQQRKLNVLRRRMALYDNSEVDDASGSGDSSTG